MSTQFGLPPCNSHITTHTPDGKSIYAPAANRSTNDIPNNLQAARLYSISDIPAKLADEADLKAFNSADGPASFQGHGIVPLNGANLSVVDFAPGGSTVMHRTQSIDFSICVIGAIKHELDSGDIVTLLPGDHIVQRGTMHKWINASQTEPARLLACILPCESFDIAGKPIKEEFLADS